MKNRATSKPSKWFRIIRGVGAALVTVAGVIITAPMTAGLSIPAGVLLTAKIVAIAGASAGLTAHSANPGE